MVVRVAVSHLEPRGKTLHPNVPSKLRDEVTENISRILRSADFKNFHVQSCHTAEI